VSLVTLFHVFLSGNNVKQRFSNLGSSVVSVKLLNRAYSFFNQLVAVLLTFFVKTIEF
jgi:hypothetical protein